MNKYLKNKSLNYLFSILLVSSLFSACSGKNNTLEKIESTPTKTFEETLQEGEKVSKENDCKTIKEIKKDVKKEVKELKEESKKELMKK